MATNTTLEALRAAWDFIENITDDDPERTDKFFKLRAQVRDAFSLTGRDFNGKATKPLERTTDEPTNEERADRIDTVMQAYCLTLEGRDFDGDEDDVKDMLTDLMHFCERMEIDFEENLRVARNNYEHERNAEKGTPNNIGCPVCGCFLEVSRTDTLLRIDREIFECQNCDETFIRELTVADSPIERAVKCVGCGNMIPQSSARIFYQRDDLAHFIGECCWDERLRD